MYVVIWESLLPTERYAKSNKYRKNNSVLLLFNAYPSCESTAHSFTILAALNITGSDVCKCYH